MEVLANCCGRIHDLILLLSEILDHNDVDADIFTEELFDVEDALEKAINNIRSRHKYTNI